MNAWAGPDAARSDLLERLLARASAENARPDWREQAFRQIAAQPAPMPGIAAAALYGELGASDAAAVFLATPVHCQAGMVSVRLPAAGLIGLGADAARLLAQDFNRDFGDGAQRLIATDSGRLFCAFAMTTSAVTHDPHSARGRDIGPFLPAGVDGARLRGLMSEIEMWLFDRPLNDARAKQGLLPLTGLWLWGGGAPLERLPPLHGFTAGSDALFGAWPGARSFPPEPGNGVIVLDAEPGTAAWTEAESAWLRPALTALRHGRIRQLDLDIGSRQLALRRTGSLRFWRRARPWWEYLA
jgi:hypothetical protein